MENDGLVILNEYNIQITEKGKPFIRNICMAFDLRLQKKSSQIRLFSLSI